MAIYASLKDYRFSEEVQDIRGANIYGVDGEKLGTIDDVIFENVSGDLKYIVVDTGGWLKSNKFLVPAREIMNTVEGEDHFHVNLTKDQIKRLPEYNEELIVSDEKWIDYEAQYESAHKWGEGSVQHRKGSTRIITSEPGKEIPSDVSEEPVTMSRSEFLKEGTLRSEYDAPSEEEFIGEEQRPSEVSKTVVDEPAEHALERGRRFREFQERLRREREKILRRHRERKAA